MATSVGRPAGPIGLARRVVEWGVLLAVLALLFVAFLQKSLEVQGQAEVAAVRTNLAALRTAMVLEHIGQKTASAQMVVNSQRNPFFLLQQMPGSYRGEHDMVRTAATGPGWYFDATCDCVAYVAANARFASESGAIDRLLYRLERSGGPTRLQALDRYSWQGQAVE